jgi:dienelactone hydrolase
MTGSRGAAVAISVVALALWTWRSSEQVLAGAVLESWRIQALDLGFAAAIGLVVAGVVQGVGRLVKRRPAFWLPWAVVGSGFLVATMGAGASLLGWLVWVGVVLLAAGLVGWGLFASEDDRHELLQLGTGVTMLVAMAGYLLAPGFGATAWQDAAPAVETADPTVPRFATTETRYDAPPVDASGIVGGWAPRAEVWGFDADAFPVRGLLWRPTGDGPFPLVVVVHGNSPFDHSEEGFRYLGQTLAARGYVVAAVDQNFLSTGVLDRADPITGATEARPWLIREHVRWLSTQPGVDATRVALVGHSRGGEAVAAAAAQGGVGTVVALAPSEGQLPPTTLSGVDYLTVAGTHDADVGTFAGVRQYERTGGALKAAVALYRGNHTQFNEGWGRHDVGLGAAADLLATAPLLSPEEQRRVTSVLVAGFLELTVRGDESFRGLFDGTAAVPGVETVRRFDPGTPLTPVAVDAERAPLPTRLGPSPQVYRTTARTVELPPGGTLDAAADGPGVRILLDGRPVGEVPGILPVDVVKPPWPEVGGEPLLQTFTAPAGRELVVSNPEGRTVYLDAVGVR